MECRDRPVPADFPPGVRLCPRARLGAPTVIGFGFVFMAESWMKTILVASSKGGVGKTTIATHLAAQAALSGKRTVLVDADPQRSSTRWAERRAVLDSAVLPMDGTRAELGWQPALPEDTPEVIVDGAAGAKAHARIPLNESADSGGGP